MTRETQTVSFHDSRTGDDFELDVEAIDAVRSARSGGVGGEPRPSLPRAGTHRLSACRSSVERLEAALRALAAERQALREREAGRGELESNRLELVHLQWQFSYALIDRHLPRLADSAAA